MTVLNVGTVITGNTISGMRVVERPLVSLTDDFVAKWAELESRSVEGNAFLSPHFVIPAVKHLKNASDQKPLILSVESEDGSELLAVGLFEQSRCTRLLPLTHLQSWRCEHTLFDGLLVERDRGAEALTTLFGWLRQQGSRWHGIAFTDRSADGELNRMLNEAATQTGVTWFENWNRQRAIIPVSEVPEDCFQTLYSKSRRRTFKRSTKRLASRGEVTFEFQNGGAGKECNVQAFLELEALGWKSEEGTALMSSPGHETFCREMAANFSSERRLIVYQLSVDSIPVASVLNMRSSDDVFSFKMGWNPEFADGSPGVLNDLNFMQNCREHLADANVVDSCAKVGSFLEDIWPWKRSLTTGVFTTSRTGTLAANAMTQLKRLKRMLKNV